MAIYPILNGQKFSQKNAIPPRGSMSEPHGRPRDLHSAGDSSAAQQPLNVPAPVPEGQPLPATGAKEGPVIDFHEDMKRDLPENLKRTVSADSEDEFVDAQG
jgi:hypothetical protein